MRLNTFLGLLAILFWSTNVAFSRSLIEQLGLFTSGAAIFLIGGGLSLAYIARREKGLGFLKRASKKYLFGCGLLFVVNTVTLQLAIGLSASRTQTIIAGLINYLWPSFSLWFSIFILGKKARWFLPAGLVLSFGGMWLASTNGEVLNVQEVLQPATLVVYAVALIAAVTWGLYSNWSRKLAGGANDSGAVPVFLICTGASLGLVRLFVPEVSTFSAGTAFELAYMMIFPTMLAYIFWDAAMRKGRMITIVSLSYFIPLFSTIISALRLGVNLRPEIWLAAGLIIVGAYFSRAAIVE
jgi:drug/metabolite transporter (DMT)-like permease